MITFDDIRRFCAKLTGLVLLVCLGVLIYGRYDYNRQSFTDVPQERTPLINGIASYQSIEDVRRSLGISLEDWLIIEDSGRDSISPREKPYWYVDVRIEYQHMGCMGELNLAFFNDRLMHTTFSPRGCPEYLDRLGQDIPVLKEGDDEIMLEPFTGIYSYTGKSTIGGDSLVVVWTDVRLEREFKRRID